MSEIVQAAQIDDSRQEGRAEAIQVLQESRGEVIGSRPIQNKARGRLFLDLQKPQNAVQFITVMNNQSSA